MPLTKVQSQLLGTGTVLQVVQTAYSTQFTTTSTTPVTTGISATITPSSASSKILMLLVCNGIYAQGVANYFTVFRNGSNIAPGGGNNPMGELYCNVANVLANVPNTYLDSPASTSAQTYTLYFWTSSGTAMLNQGNVNGNTTITLMEIAG